MRKKEQQNLDFFETDIFKQALKEFDIERVEKIESILDKTQAVPIHTKTYLKIEKLFKLEQMSTIDKIYFFSNRLAVGLIISSILTTAIMI